uniref:protein SFI1 homolog n=1 Tax=Styela clava TaxID=7725 RepID=UPI00193AA590|nr:protein SFI1 homolog [Styela clava]
MMDRSINTENFGVESSISSNEDDTSISIMTSSLSSSDAIIDEIYDVIEPATREILKRKPKPVLPIHPCLRDSSIPTIEWLVRLVVIRMRYRPLAFAFHQWKLLIHTKKWEQEMLAHMKERTRFLNIKQYLRQWKTNYKKATSSRNHYRQNLEQRCFHEWLQWTMTKRARQRMKTEADRIYSSKVLRSAMNTWNGKWQHRLALLEILKYWQTRTKQHNSPRMKDERTQHRLNSELLSNCFERWRLKYRQLALSDQHRRKTLLGGILTAWSNCASERAEVSMRISDMRSYHLKRRIFIAWKKHTSLMKQVELIRKRSLRNWISSLLDRWHQYATAKHHHDSALDKISNLSQSRAVQTCLDRWRLEFTKTKLADMMNRRSLMKKAIHEWHDVTIAWAADRQRIETMRRTVATNQKRTALTNWRNELALKAKVDSAREQRYSNLLWRSWCLWRERVALKRASHTYMLFLKRRTFNSWKKFLQQKRNSDEKARTVLLKWHEMVVRSQNLLCMADQFQMKSCNFTVEFTFNTWLIAHSQNKIAKLHYKNKILRKSFAAILSRTKRKKSLKRMQMNFVRQRTKELFAFSWHNYFESLINGLLCLNATSQKSKLIQDSAIQILTTWWTCSSTLRNERRVVSDLEESRNKILTITTFMVWLKSYKNNKIACKFAENKMKKKAFNSLKIWKTESIRLKKCYSQAVQIVETLMLKFYFTQWKSMFRKVRMLEVTCDRMMEVKSNKMLKSSWKKWFKAKENRDLQKRHERDSAFDVITKWRRYAADRVEKQRIREERNVMVGRFEQKWIWKRSFSKWKGKYQVNQFSRNNKQNLMERCWQSWSSKTAMIICAVEMDYHWTLRKYWHWWRLEHVTKNSTNEATEQMNHDMKKTIFELWRAYTYKKLTGRRYCSPESLKPEALTPRKRSRIPVLKK